MKFPSKGWVFKDLKGKQYEFWGYDPQGDLILVRELREGKRLTIPRKQTEFDKP